MSAERKKLLEVENLTVRFGSAATPSPPSTASPSTSLRARRLLVGESGSGKTTIGRAIIRIHPTSAGTVTFDGKQINGRIPRALDHEVTRRIQMIFRTHASLNERAKVDYIVSEGLMNIHPEMSKAERDQRVAQALLDVGLLPEFASRFPHEFSGGQRQRVAAGGEVGAGEELAVAAHLVDHHRPALFAGNVGHLILNGDLFDAGLGLFQILFKWPVEVAHDGVPVHLSLFHVVEFLLHVGGELYVDDVGEVLAHQIVDDLAQFRGDEALVLARHIAAGDDGGDGRRVGGGAAYALFLQRAHQRSLRVRRAAVDDAVRR